VAGRLDGLALGGAPGRTLMDNAIEVRHLTKSYGPFLAVDHISFDVRAKGAGFHHLHIFSIVYLQIH
jgi:hypothetical protein